jgi:hypothetical protein
MKAGTQNHLKVKRLMRLLGIPLYRAVGILESLWLLCADCCDEGDIGKYTDEEIADYLGWDGPQSPSELVRALSDSGWTDPDSECRLVVHDWLEHCPEYIRDRVRKRNARGGKRRKQTTYASPEPDKTPNSRTGPGVSGVCPTLSENVPSIPNPTNPNPTQPIPTPGADKPREKGRSPVTLEQLEIPESLNTAEARASIDEWLRYKRSRGESYKEPGHLNKKLLEFARAGPLELIAAVDFSIGNNYAGLVPGKQNGNQRKLPIGPGQSHNPAARERDPNYGRM